MEKRIILLMLVAIFAMSTFSYGASYSDTTKYYWAHESIQTMSAKGIVKGYPDGKFKPSNNVTYGEFIKMALVSATGKNVGDVAGYDAEAIIKGFSDVNPRRTHSGHIAKAYYSGIINGYNDGTFKPDATLTRAEASTVIHRLIDSSKRAVYIPPSAVSEEKLPLREIIKNLESFANPGNGLINDYLPMAKDYTIIKDPSVYKMSLKTNRGTNWIEVENANNTGMIFYVKDNYVIEFPQTSPGGDGSRAFIYKTDISKVDYIMSLHINDGYMDLIVNPFKK